jgi:glycosyltransferase involved in cell wall biosynthesis
MNAAVVNPYLNGLTGVVRLTFDVARVFKKMFGHVEVLTFGTVNPEVISKYHNTGVTISTLDDVDLKELSLIGKLMYNIRLQKISSNIDYDFLFFTDGYYLVRGFKNIPKVLYVYFPYSLSYRKSFKQEVEDAPVHIKVYRYVYRDIEKFLIYKSKDIKGVIVYSNFVKRVFEKYFGLTPYVLMPPLDTDFFVPPADLHRKFESDVKLILCVTRFHPHKEHELVVEAFKKYIKRKDVMLVIAGYVSDYKYFKYIKSLASNDSRIKLIPNPSDEELLKLYQEATLFWYVHEEHCATTPLEAMACGTPVVMLNKPGLNEVVKQGINGYLVNNLEELGRLTEKLLDNVEKLIEMGVNARKMAVEFYSYQVFENKLRNIIEMIIRT